MKQPIIVFEVDENGSLTVCKHALFTDEDGNPKEFASESEIKILMQDEVAANVTGEHPHGIVMLQVYTAPRRAVGQQYATYPDLKCRKEKSGGEEKSNKKKSK